ncbi:MAG: rRNA methyltransferase [Clostridia bacterium]|nr:rRNA methyltransferase [Clostridia bacterium]
MPIIRKMSARDAAFQRFEAVKRSREKRAKQKVFFVEGVHPIEQAVRFGWAFEALGYAADTRLSGWANDMRSKARAETEYQISPALMDELSEREESCELIALVKQRQDGLERMSRASGAPFYVLFDRPQSPGNLGTVIRSADAFGAAGLITTGHAADPYDPQCVRASIGTVFALPFAALESVDAAMAWLDTLPVRPRVVGTSAHGSKLIDAVDLTGPTLLLIGNETFGLSKAWKEACDELALIPIHGAASSLNAGCAASICFYELARQRANAAL